MEFPVFVVDAAAGVLLTGTLLWSGYALACRLTRGASASVRLTATSIVVLWELTVALLLLSAVRLFTRPVVLAIWCVAAIVAHRVAKPIADPMQQFRDDLAAVRGWWALTSRPLRLLIGVAGGLQLVRIAHGLLAPCLTWDALTYHLYKPAVWGQSGGMMSTTGPDAAAYYAWFPPYGDAVWGWWLLAMRGDVAIAPVAVGMWLMIALACYACARELGAPPERATAAALAVAFTPAVISFGTFVYIDNLVVGLFLAGLLFLARTIERRNKLDAVLSAAAFAVLAGVKGTVLPVCAVGILAALALAGSRAGFLATLVAALPSIVPPLLAWHATGSPVYPLTVRVGGRVLIPGNSELEWLLHAGWMSDAAVEDARTRVMGRLFLPWVRLNNDFLNLGLGPLLLLPTVVPGLITMWRSKRSRYVAVFLILVSGLTMASVMGEANRGLTLWWWGLLGRHLTIVVAAAALITAAWPSRLSTLVLTLCAVAGVVVAWPGGVSIIDVRAGQAVLPALLIIAAGVWIVGRFLPRARVPVRWIAVVGIMSALIVVRDQFRYEYYDAAQRWRAYDVHTIDARWTASWPVWQRFDGDAPFVLAVSAGWDGIGHNWYRYPLLGRRLQNRLIYVPISRDGSLFDYGLRPDDFPPTSCAAWRDRLFASPAEYLVLLPPLPPETAWADANPGTFPLEMDLGHGLARAYRIVRHSDGSGGKCD